MSDIDFASMRAAMVASQLRTNSVNDPALLAAIEAVRREDFVPEARAGVAYADVPVPLDGGRGLNAPLVSARLIMEAGVSAGHSVLLIGAATGYIAAILSRIAAKVVAVEENSVLLAEARKNLTGLANVELVEGPLAAGAPAHAPFDAVIIDGAVEFLPSVIWDQMAEGARVATGLVRQGVTHIARGMRIATSHGMTPVIEMQIVGLPGFAEKKGFVF